MPSGVRSRLARTLRFRRRRWIPRSVPAAWHHAVERNGEVSVQPVREIAFEAGDGLVLFACQDRVLEVVSRNLTGATN